jgi:hypothetical protein
MAWEKLYHIRGGGLMGLRRVQIACDASEA